MSNIAIIPTIGSSKRIPDKNIVDLFGKLMIVWALEAAEKVNQIWDDVEGWWKQPKVQKARKEWAWQYARTSKYWRWEWIKFLRKI